MCNSLQVFHTFLNEIPRKLIFEKKVQMSEKFTVKIQMWPWKFDGFV